MPAKCIHLRAAVIATGAQVLSHSGQDSLGDVRWCTQCGAVLALISGQSTRWLLPGSEDTERAYRAMLERDAQDAEQQIGASRAR